MAAAAAIPEAEAGEAPPSHSDAEVDGKLGRAAAAFEGWRRTPFAERARHLREAAAILDAEAKDIARLIAGEMGKPITAGAAEAAKCASCCRYYAEHGERMLADEPVDTGGRRTYVTFQPLGVVLAVMPWNFPFWQVLRFAAPCLAAGNVALLKHASNVPRCALAIEAIFRRAGCPEGVFQTLLIDVQHVGRVIEDPRVAAVTLTGSEGAGSSVASRAGKHLKKTVLELGGSDPFVVMRSADLDAAVATGVKARTLNSGQSCIAAKRFIVDVAIADEFERRFVAAMERVRVGDPLDASVEMGPMATPELLAQLEEQVARSVASGARVLTGGRRLDRAGSYYPPTVMTGGSPDAAIYPEEIFGPVAALLRARDVDDAIRLANDSKYGLGASVWTRDQGEQARFVEGIAAGQVFVNAMVASDPRMPFGGIKLSGYGRELAAHGLREFVNAKSVWIEAAAPESAPDTE